MFPLGSALCWSSTTSPPAFPTVPAIPPPHPFVGVLNLDRHGLEWITKDRQPRPRPCSGSLVDENVIVLRNQIHELQIVEKNHRHPPDGWMDSEWRYHCSSYGADLCDVAAILQSLLINTRPGVSLAVGSLFAFYLPTPPSSSSSSSSSISWKP